MAARGKKHLRCPDASTLAEAIAGRCDNAKQGKDGWMACCPSHDDTNASLHITPNGDKVLLHCFAGCTPEVIIGVLGLDLADLFVHQENGQSPRIVAVYDYTDAHGTLLHQTVRFEPKKFRQRRPNPDQPHAFLWDLKTIEPVLYHLPEVQHAITAGDTIYIVEGEKDADLLQSKGLIATCNPMGAGKWRESYTEALRDGVVVILPDYDLAGKRHAEGVAQALLGVAKELKVIETFHTEATGSDVTDWIAAGGTREEFEAIVETAERYTGPTTLPPVGFGGKEIPSDTILAGMGPGLEERVISEKEWRTHPKLF